MEEGRKGNTNFLNVFHAVIPKIPAGTREITRAKRILILTKSTPAKILESARGRGGGGGGDNDIKSAEVIPLYQQDYIMDSEPWKPWDCFSWVLEQIVRDLMKIPKIVSCRGDLNPAEWKLTIVFYPLQILPSGRAILKKERREGKEKEETTDFRNLLPRVVDARPG